MVNGASLDGQIDCVADDTTAAGSGLTTAFFQFICMHAMKDLPTSPALYGSGMQPQAFMGGSVHPLDLRGLVHHHEHRRDRIKNLLQEFVVGVFKSRGHGDCPHLDICQRGW